MRAMVMSTPGGAEVLHPLLIEQPAIAKPGEMLVRVIAAGVNPVDAKLRARGTYFPKELPSVLGCDGAGIVEAVGSEVTHFRPGDAIYYCYGGLGQARCGNYAEYAVIDAAFAASKPAALSFAEAAAAPLVLITAWESLFDRAQLGEGMKVLIHAGAGGVGHVAIQLAKLAGAEVATTVGSPDKAAFVRALGADLIIDYTQQDFVAEVLKWSDGRGVDICLDTVGGEIFNRSIGATAFYGDLVTLLQVTENADWKTARLRNLRISQELMLSPMVCGLPEGGEHHSAILDQCGQFFDEGKLKIHLGAVLPLGEAQQAHRLIEEGHTTGKIVLKID